MRKRITVLVLLLILLFPCIAYAGARVSTQKLVVDGKNYECEKYYIDGYNYFKLRDIAYLLRESNSKFDVVWDTELRAVSIKKGHTYTVAGGELEMRKDYSSSARLSSQKLYVDGSLVNALKPYNIGEYNFFKLRDLGELLEFYVDYDGTTNSAVITTKKDNEVWNASGGEAESFMLSTSDYELKMYGLSNYPEKKDGEWMNVFRDNLLLMILNGETETRFKLSSFYDSRKMSEDKSSWISVYPELCGEYINLLWTLGSESDNRRIDATLKIDDILEISPEEVLSRQSKSFEKAENIISELHTKDKITATMNEYEKATAISNFLYDYINPISAYAMLYNGGYDGLISRKANCVGRAAAFNLLMHAEGLASCGLNVYFGDNWNGEDYNHCISLCVLDGKYYCVDYANDLGIFPLENPPKVIRINQDSLVFAKEAISAWTSKWK